MSLGHPTASQASPTAGHSLVEEKKLFATILSTVTVDAHWDDAKIDRQTGVFIDGRARRIPNHIHPERCEQAAEQFHSDIPQDSASDPYTGLFAYTDLLAEGESGFLQRGQRLFMRPAADPERAVSLGCLPQHRHPLRRPAHRLRAARGRAGPRR